MPRHTPPTSPAEGRFHKGLGQRCKEFRIKRGLTQDQIAEKIGVNTKHYQALELGQVVSLRMIWRVAKALKTPVEELTRGLGPGRPKVGI